MDKTRQMNKFHEWRTRLRQLYKQTFTGGKKANNVNNNFKKSGMYSKTKPGNSWCKGKNRDKRKWNRQTI